MSSHHKIHPSRGLHVIAYPAMVDVPRELVTYVSRLLAAQRRVRGTRCNSRVSTSTTAHATPCSADCAAWANAASSSSPDAGAPYNTSPPAPAKSAPSSKPHSSSPNSNTANTAKVGEITSLSVTTIHPSPNHVTNPPTLAS